MRTPPVPPIGSRFVRVKSSGHSHRVLELVAEDASQDPVYRYVMCVVESGDEKAVPVGHTFTVEALWFVHRHDFRLQQPEETTPAGEPTPCPWCNRNRGVCWVLPCLELELLMHDAGEGAPGNLQERQLEEWAAAVGLRLERSGTIFRNRPPVS